MKKYSAKLTMLMSAATLTLFGITSCQKENSSQSRQNEEVEVLNKMTVNDAQIDLIFSQIHEEELGLIEEIPLPNIGLNETHDVAPDTPRCVSVSIVPGDPLTYPKIVTVQYGINGCGSERGKKGKRQTIYTAPMHTPGATATTTFSDFYMDGIKIEGTHITKNQSVGNTVIFTRTVVEGKLTFPDGSIVVYNATHTNKQVEGMTTPRIPADDAFEISGGARGVVRSNGTATEWSRVIVEPLHKAFRCRWVDKGVVHIKRNENKAILNFGRGTCDNEATLTINGETKQIRLP